MLDWFAPLAVLVIFIGVAIFISTKVDDERRSLGFLALLSVVTLGALFELYSLRLEQTQVSIKLRLIELSGSTHVVKSNEEDYSRYDLGPDDTGTPMVGYCRDTTAPPDCEVLVPWKAPKPKG